MPPVYEDLREGEFRLLSLHDDSGLSCSLDRYRMDKAPRYIALSYTWGLSPCPKERPMSLSYQVTLNNEIIEVQQNLFDALRTLSLYVRATQSLLWVDALCINQEDLGERSEQVRAMQGIYEQSFCVVAWLGLPDDDEETRLAIQYMHDFDHIIKDIAMEHSDSGAMSAAFSRTFTEDHVAFPRLRPSQGIEPITAWFGIARIMMRDYWERTWIRQEATAPTPILFFCGEHSFDNSCLSHTIDVSQAFSSLPHDRAWMCSLPAVSAPVLIVHARYRRGNKVKAPLIDLIANVRQTKCSDPRDKVYATISQAPDVTSSDFVVDYRRSLVDVYMDVADFALFRAGMAPFEALGLVYMPADPYNELSSELSTVQEPEIPSWIPDWRQIHCPVRFVDSRKMELGAPHLYTPWPGSEFDAQIRVKELDLTALVVHGLTVSSLTEVWTAAQGLSRLRTWYDAMSASGDNLKNAKNDDVGTSDDAIRRCFVGDRSVIEHRYSGRDGVVRRGGMLDKALIEQERSHPLSLFEDYSDSRALNICWIRRMSRLSNGSVALLPAAAKVGDTIAAFSGGHCLYLLRPVSYREAAYKFIGECYVDGFMDGELLSLSEDKDRSVTKIRLV